MKRRNLTLPRETIRQLVQLTAVRAGVCTGSCDTCPSLWLTCVGNTCTA